MIHPVVDVNGWSESAAVRRWAETQGYEVGDRGRLPTWLRERWMRAGCPYPKVRYEDAEPLPKRPAVRTKGRRNSFVTPTHPVHDPIDEEFVLTGEVAPNEDGPIDDPPAVAARQQAAAQALAAGTAPTPAPPATAPGKVVTFVSGATAEVMTAEEAIWFEESKGKYQAEHRLTENTDVQDLDRLLQMELVLHRWGQWVLSGVDYQNRAIDSIELTKKIREQSTAINSLKEQMGLSRKARDAAGANLAERWNDLLQRAKAFGYHRENQLREAMVLMNEISKVVGAYYRCDPEERQKIGFPTEAAVVEWLRDQVLPRYAEVDAHFVENEQKLWRRESA